ncbi:MAG: grasp-with-spasm system SPASM domain peptide maturase [Flavobacteriaceae bacterium]|nr:grasp-with-spasm system SPASM domain peptide maturase [Flavobacteriaceae bacterium]
MNYFKTFANCLLIKGVSRSLICDLQRHQSDLISNDMVEILVKLNAKQSISSVMEEYGDQNNKVIQEYLEYLDDKEYGFYCKKEEFDRFPSLDKKYLVPGHITNAVLELSRKTIYSLNELVPQIESLGCKDITIMFYESLRLEDFYQIFNYFEDTRIKSIEITLKYNQAFNELFFAKLNKKINQLTRLTFYSAKEEKVDHWDNYLQFERIFTTKNITSFKSCGIVDSKYFTTNLPKVLEAINHNSCLHKKISIDINGKIKNCPAMPESFGNINETLLKEAINAEGFKKYWNITKDQIITCKDCEFRYICTDCRAYIENPLDKYSKPLKCGYNPYTMEWEEWAVNPLKQKSIEYYGLTELLNNHQV